VACPVGNIAIQMLCIAAISPGEIPALEEGGKQKIMKEQRKSCRGRRESIIAMLTAQYCVDESISNGITISKALNSCLSRDSNKDGTNVATKQKGMKTAFPMHIH
jgi:hypothetical protein